MKPIDQWLNEYGESHKEETNKTIHWICVPTIFLSFALFKKIKIQGSESIDFTAFLFSFSVSYSFQKSFL